MEIEPFTVNDTAVRNSALEVVVRSLLATLDAQQAKDLMANLEKTFAVIEKVQPEATIQINEVVRQAAFDIASAATDR
ncbi:hypothetical protein ACT35X_000290 [Enterobacter hormaechei]|uniref:hypothetical protein n=1 Tax=Enterobacter hormaechei TaxID=158836 RepID=UPI0007355BC2|nr:hypothetical protein [Enterobacter hormaechei]AVE74537.1 hypothetical protein AM439_19925 [Enterobacter cloacae complex sp.]MDU3798233.1 hypothetical protein [Bifidobacterium breve]DAN15193.1 MAG TPA: hypothetical protein [Caudoviricetes sp.]HCJ7634995.1 hypothetical protein [Enterobacter hormaechei subsp. xiangfangensis]AVE74583.1 hypothetical protein AM439_20195 [Enterobacter cloacae complex sp.]